ncbi:MAG: hypothetical protein HQL06_12485 [Nitrospirae bacterium]|nr:hypothetical protein [Nitrospirota bacterium]
MTKKIKERRNLQHAKSVDPPDEQDEKMSDLIMEYAEPMLEKGKNFEQKRRAMNLSIMFWNASFLSEDDQKDAMKKILAENRLNRDDRVTLFKVFIAMINRKFKEFSDINRVILKYKVTEAKNSGLHLSVTSKIAEGEHMNVFTSGDFMPSR